MWFRDQEDLNIWKEYIWKTYPRTDISKNRPILERPILERHILEWTHPRMYESWTWPILDETNPLLVRCRICHVQVTDRSMLFIYVNVCLVLYKIYIKKWLLWSVHICCCVSFSPVRYFTYVYMVGEPYAMCKMGVCKTDKTGFLFTTLYGKRALYTHAKMFE